MVRINCWLWLCACVFANDVQTVFKSQYVANPGDTQLRLIYSTRFRVSSSNVPFVLNNPQAMGFKYLRAITLQTFTITVTVDDERNGSIEAEQMVSTIVENKFGKPAVIVDIRKNAQAIIKTHFTPPDISALNGRKVTKLSGNVIQFKCKPEDAKHIQTLLDGDTGIAAIVFLEQGKEMAVIKGNAFSWEEFLLTLKTALPPPLPQTKHASSRRPARLVLL